MEKQYQQKHHDISISIKNIVNTFSCISLKEMNSVALLNRTFKNHYLLFRTVIRSLHDHLFSSCNNIANSCRGKFLFRLKQNRFGDYFYKMVHI